MKKILMLIFLFVFVSISYGQLKAPYGIKVGEGTTHKTGSNVSTIDSITIVSGKIKMYNGSVQKDPYISKDTILLYNFGYGIGSNSDTTNLVLTSDFGGFYNDGSDTLVITKVIGIVKASKNSPGVYINIYFHKTYFYATPDSVLSSSLNIISLTTGTFSTTFKNNKIPPGVFVWCKPAHSFPINGTIPSKLRVSISGYKVRKY